MGTSSGAELVVVTGAGSGIGRATTLRFAAQGATVIAADINLEAVEETVQLVVGRGGKAHAYQVDVSDLPAMEAFAAQVASMHGVADVVVNNAGFATAGPFLEHAPEDIDRLLAVNLMGVIHGSRLFGLQMVQRGQGGHIVNIASGAAYTPFALMNTYCTSKAAVKMFSECLRVELAGDGIGVTAICPGGISTSIIDNAKQISIDAEERTRRTTLLNGGLALLDRVPGHRPDSVAKAIVSSVRRNTAVRPVAIESWFAYVVSSVAPPMMRWMSTLTVADDLASLSDRVIPDRVRAFLSRRRVR